MDEGTNLRAIVKANGGNPAEITTAVFNLLDYCRGALMLPNTREQTDCLLFIAIQIIEEYANAVFTLEEIIYAMQKGLKGGYGKVYNKFNAEVINGWLDQLYAEKMAIINDRHQNNKWSDANRSDRSPEPVLARTVFDRLVDDKVNQRITAYKRKVEESKKEEGL